MSATASLPNLQSATDASTNVQTGVKGFLSVAGALSEGGADSPLNGVFSALGDLQSTLDVDVSGLTTRLPQALTVIGNALPADTLNFVEQLEDAYRQLSNFLNNSELVKQIQPGMTLEQAALAVVDDVLDLFRNRLADLGEGLIDSDTLDAVKGALEVLESLAGGGSIDAEPLLDFLSENLVGVAPDLLSNARNQLESALNFIQPLSAGSVSTLVTSAQASLAPALQNLATAIKEFDAGDTSAYPALEALLLTYSNALNTTFSLLEGFYSALNTVVAAPQWAVLFDTYTDVLNAIPLSEIPTVNDAVDELVRFMESLLSRLTMSLSPEDLAARVDRISQSIQSMFADSPIHQVRQILIGFIGEIEQAIAAVPAEAVQQAVDGMLSRVGQEIQNLDIGAVRSGIESGFAQANQFIDDNLGGDLLTEMNQQLAAALDQLNAIPVADLGDTIASAINQAGQVVADLQSSLSSGLDEIRNLLITLDSVDYKPVSNEVVDEIRALKSKLQSINPNALSDVEKLAIQAGLAVLSAIDLKGEIVVGLKSGYAGIHDELANAVQKVLDAWLEFRRRIGILDASALTAPITGLLDELGRLVNRLNGNLLIAPLQDLVNQLIQQLQSLSPAALLDPLQAPYDRLMQILDRVNPDVWVQPLRALHTEIDRLIDLIDITPLLDELESRQKALFAEVNQEVIGALDAVQLPAPLDAFYDQVKVLIQAVSDAVFGDPDGTLRTVSLALSETMRPSLLLQPLDAAFDRLLSALEALPGDQVLAALETLRSGLGTVLPALNPAHIIQELREAEGRLASISPANLALGAVQLPALRARLEISFEGHSEYAAAQASLLAQFDLTLAPLQFNEVNAGLYRLHQSHQQLVNSLRQQINRLDSGGARMAYQRLETGLRRLLPDFLLQTTPLQLSDIQAALASLRPSTQARRLDTVVERFIAEVKPLQSALEDSTNGFFGAIRQTAMLLYPGDIKDAIASVYATLRDKLHILDPDELAADLRTQLWEPLLDPLQAINPAALKAQLQALFDNLLNKVSTGITELLVQVKQSLDAFLGQIRAAISGILDALMAQVNAVLEQVDALIEQLDNLIVEDLFQRLLNLLSNLKTSFNLELDRVSNEFDAMLNAIPLSGSTSASLGS
jgi:phage-related protein